MQKKVGLAIVTYVNNYGSYLQSYATQEAIKNLGYETEVININGVKKIIGKARRKYFLSRITNVSEIKSYIVTLHGFVKKKIDKNYREKINIRNEQFAKFRDNKFTFSPAFDTWEEIGNYCKEKYYAVVVGSDQLWRPANIEGDYYTLNFVPEEVNKVAYATSFGVSKLPYKQALKAQKFLPRINNISVREEAGKSLVKDLTNIEASLVCDPTMLLTENEWEKLTGKQIIKNKYILCYFLGNNELYLKFAKRMKRKLNGFLLVGIVHGAGYNRGAEVYFDETPFDIDPFGFINLIKYSSFVLTDSFHCCVFSILFEREFFSFRRFADEDEMSTNDRLVTLFRECGIEDRLLMGMEAIDEVLERKIDYQEVKDRIVLLKENSINYLKGALRNA